MDFWTDLLAHLRSGEPAFVALVADNTAHSPGTRGAKMFVRPDGSIEGTIGGGIMESDVIDRGLASLKQEAEPDYQRLYHRKSGSGDKSGLICAGHQTNVYCMFRPERDMSLVEEIVQRLEDDETGLLQLGPSGYQVAEEDDISPSRPPIRLVEQDSAWRYEEQLLNWKRAAIIGGGHCGFALSRTLDHLGYTVTLFDTRADVETFADNEHARHTIHIDDFAEAGEHIEHEQITHVIVMTMGQPGDVRALLGVVEDPYPYIGVMGSAAKLTKIRKDLEAEGIDPEVFDDRVHAPVGLEMTSNTPEEIAVSVAGELLREREALFPHSAPSEPTPPDG
jgi:xanthine dehydrogenase accessory factor